MFAFEVTPMDHDLFAAINGLAGRLRLADLVAVAFSTIGPFLLLIALRRQRLALIAAIGTGGSLLVNQILIRVWSRPRPFAVEAARLLLPPSPDPSFPSDHATFAFAVAAGLFLVSKRLGFTALILAALIALSRVYVGEHYLSDVVVGALIGSGATFAAASARGALEPLLAGIIRVARRLHLA
jgi:undecaprenyl-diphosphatase